MKIEIKDPKTGIIHTFDQDKITRGEVRHAVGRGKLGYKKIKYYLDQAGLPPYVEEQGRFSWPEARVCLSMRPKYKIKEKGWVIYNMSRIKWEDPVRTKAYMEEIKAYLAKYPIYTPPPPPVDTLSINQEAPKIKKRRHKYKATREQKERDRQRRFNSITLGNYEPKVRAERVEIGPGIVKRRD